MKARTRARIPRRFIYIDFYSCVFVIAGVVNRSRNRNDRRLTDKLLFTVRPDGCQTRALATSAETRRRWTTTQKRSENPAPVGGTLSGKSTSVSRRIRVNARGFLGKNRRTGEKYRGRRSKRDAKASVFENERSIGGFTSLPLSLSAASVPNTRGTLNKQHEHARVSGKRRRLRHTRAASKRRKQPPPPPPHRGLAAAPYVRPWAPSITSERFMTTERRPRRPTLTGLLSSSANTHYLYYNIIQSSWSRLYDCTTA